MAVNNRNLPLTTPINTLHASGAGLSNGGVISINTSDNSKIDITAGHGYFVDVHTDPDNPDMRRIEWADMTGVTVTTIATQVQSYVLIDTNGAVQFFSSDDALNPVNFRHYIYLGLVVHTAGTTIEGFHNIPVGGTSPGDHFKWADLGLALGAINVNGNVISANGTNLSINRTAGKVWFPNVNFKSTPENPSFFDTTTFTGGFFFTQWQLTPGVFTTGFTNVLTPSVYDDGTGTASAPNGAVVSSKYSAYRVYTGTEFMILQFGQAVYQNIAEATDGILSENFTVSPDVAGALFLGWIIVRGNATDLSDPDQAVFIQAGKFGGVGAGGTSAVTNLQQSYDNSTTPEIVLNSTAGALTMRDASTPIGASLIEIENNSGTVNYFKVDATKIVAAAPSSAPADATLSNNNFTVWIDQAGANLKIKVKYSDGTVKTATIAFD